MGKTMNREQIEAELRKLEEKVQNLKNWKEKYEELLKQVEEIRAKAFEVGQASLSKDVIEDNKFLESKVKELESKITKVSTERDKQATTFLEASNEHEKNIAKSRAMVQELTDKLKHFEYFEEALRGILEPYMIKLFKAARETATAGPEIPSEISVSMEQPTISVKVERGSLALTDKGLQGRLAIVYAEGALQQSEWFSVSDVVKAFERHAWPRDPRVSKELDQFTQWGFFEKKKAGNKPIYRVVLKPDEAKAKGFLKVEEVKQG